MKPKEKADVVNNGAPIKVRFPSVREKIKVLQACRNVSKSLQDKGITTIEDFTEKVRKFNIKVTVHWNLQLAVKQIRFQNSTKVYFT